MKRIPYLFFAHNPSFFWNLSFLLQKSGGKLNCCFEQKALIEDVKGEKLLDAKCGEGY